MRNCASVVRFAPRNDSTFYDNIRISFSSRATFAP
ncbi:hypothetical protein ACVIHI_005568 [Bradyrhizobium sp. USDA 4524]|nr:hypothetical protein [Bradyrhizobium sp. USDA 4538]MCP1902074.1 hypothetical protein [Bradyrhizobium sp. USDA 4537]MCP1992269.1 hypothetical protein [Bradyrhizobium sp. USDA 4539]